MGVQPIRKTVAPEIPDKLYFRIGDVARICEVPAYVLRFWETEFPQLKPNKGGTGQRLYRKRDVEMALRIKALLYDQGYTIPGARQVFKNEARVRETGAAESFAPAPATTGGTTAQPATEIADRTAQEPGGELRRDLRLRSLRDEMQSLLSMLAASKGVQSAPASGVQAMRPRLVLEPKAVVPRTETLRLVRDAQSQGDLFPSE